MITPIVEVDGRDRQVDVYNWHLAHPNDNWPPLVYWGHYVAHDNNRDAMGLTLALTRNVLKTFLDAKAQILHDLHESVPYLYDNTVGDGPYNAWLDPILTNEWQMLGWNNVAGDDPVRHARRLHARQLRHLDPRLPHVHGGDAQRRLAALRDLRQRRRRHGRADAPARATTRAPGTARTRRSRRRSGPSATTTTTSRRGCSSRSTTWRRTAQTFLRNFYLKSKRSIEKPAAEGPAAYVFPADDPRPGAQAELLRILQMQGCEVSPSAFGRCHRSRRGEEEEAEGRRKRTRTSRAAAADKDKKDDKKPPPEPREFPAGSYVVRMDQPYSRIADMLLDYQYWSPDDPQQTAVRRHGLDLRRALRRPGRRATDPKVLDVPVERVAGCRRRRERPLGQRGPSSPCNHNAESALATLRFRSPEGHVRRGRGAVRGRRPEVHRGSFLVRNADRDELSGAAAEPGPLGRRLSPPRRPSRRTRCPGAAHRARAHVALDAGRGLVAARLRRAEDPLRVHPHAGRGADPDLKSPLRRHRLPAVGRGAQAIVRACRCGAIRSPGRSTGLDAEPRQDRLDRRHAARPGPRGRAEPARVRARRAASSSVAMDTAELAVNFGLTPGVSVARGRQAEAHRQPSCGRRSWTARARSPTAIPRLRRSIPSTARSSTSRTRRPDAAAAAVAAKPRARHGTRHAGRSRPSVGRPLVEPPPEPKAEAWEALPLTDEQKRNPIYVILPSDRGRASSLRYADSKDLLVSGLLEGGKEIAQHPAVVDVPAREGPRRPLLEQPRLARRDARELLPRLQRDPELGQPQRGAEGRGEVAGTHPSGRGAITIRAVPALRQGTSPAAPAVRGERTRGETPAP